MPFKQTAFLTPFPVGQQTRCVIGTPRLAGDVARGVGEKDLRGLIMKKKWLYKCGEDAIVVENTWLSGERLYVNGELQDERPFGINSVRLLGQLPGGEGIKVWLGGFWNIQCRMFINDKQVITTRTK